MYIYIQISYSFGALVEFIIFDITGTADLMNLVVVPGCSFTVGLNLVFGLGSVIASKKSLCFGFLKVSQAKFFVRISLLSLRGTRSQEIRACSYDTGLPLTL